LGEAQPGPPHQARSIAKRQRIMAAARQVFAKYGFDQASVESITSHAGVAVGAFYLYFGSKRQLLVVLMNELLEKLQGIDLSPPMSGDMQRSLKLFLRKILRTDRDNYGVIRAWQEAISADDELAQLNGVIHQWTHARVRHVFERVSEHPAARRSRNIPTFAAIMDRHFWSLLAKAPTMSEGEFAREVEVTGEILYRYLLRDVVS
jgi:AcrR family transcriptional regulator